MTILNSSLQGVFYLLSLSLVSRIASFGLNLLLAKKTSYEILGEVFALELLASTILFICRENIRMAVIRPLILSPKLIKLLKATPKDIEKENNQLCVNFSIFPFLFGIGLTRLLSIYHVFYPSSLSSASSQLYITAALIELLAEPFASYVQKHLLFKIRASVEGASVILSCLATLYFYPVNAHGEDYIRQGVMAYSWSFLFASLVILLGYILLLWMHFVSQGLSTLEFIKTFTPSRGKLTGYFIHPYHRTIALSFWIQSLFKHLLTVGDRFLVVFAGFTDVQKGMYRLISDLGSLVARILFQPLEEIARTYFSKSLSSDKVTDADADKEVKIGLQVYSVLLKCQFFFGMYFVFFGTHYTQLLLSFLYNQEKATPEAARLLSVYCIYIPFMGINGIAEAFLQGIGNASVIAKQTRYLVVFWGLFLGIFVCIHSIGISALVIANTFNLFFRILFSISFAMEFFSDKGKDLNWRDLLPQKGIVWIGLVSSFMVISYFSSSSVFLFLGIGILLGIIQLLIMYVYYSKKSLKKLDLFQKNN